MNDFDVRELTYIASVQQYGDCSFLSLYGNEKTGELYFCVLCDDDCQLTDTINYAVIPVSVEEIEDYINEIKTFTEISKNKTFIHVVMGLKVKGFISVVETPIVDIDDYISDIDTYENDAFDTFVKYVLERAKHGSPLLIHFSEKVEDDPFSQNSRLSEIKPTNRFYTRCKTLENLAEHNLFRKTYKSRKDAYDAIERFVDYYQYLVKNTMDVLDTDCFVVCDYEPEDDF